MQEVIRHLKAARVPVVLVPANTERELECFPVPPAVCAWTLVPESTLAPPLFDNVRCRAVAKLEAFSQRVGQAAGRVKVLGTLLQHKEARIFVLGTSVTLALLTARINFLEDGRPLRIHVVLGDHCRSIADTSVL